MKRQRYYFILVLLFSLPAFAKTYTLVSPDKNIKLTVDVKEDITWQIDYKEKTVIAPSIISMQLGDGQILGKNPKLKKAVKNNIKNTIEPLYGQFAKIEEKYDVIELPFDNYSLEFRVYNEGAAYRFLTAFSDNITVANEKVNFQFSDDCELVCLESSNLHGYENNYKNLLISKLGTKSYLCLPLLARVPDGPNVMITESDLLDYPGLYLRRSTKNALAGFLPEYPLEVAQDKGRGFDLVVQKRADYIAKTTGTRSFPWRLVAFAENDIDFIGNNLVYLTATENKLKESSWIQPGLVAWDWWNDINMTGVDFKTGFNTETFKYFIDFAAENGIRYVNLDEGWSNQFDLMELAPELDMMAVVEYAKQKKVGLFLWCVWHTLDRQLSQALDRFAEWNIAGIKVDFMNRDDQIAVNFYQRVAEEAAKRKILVNFHGAYKPTGLCRTYPNVINREAVLGLEYSKWSNRVTPKHDVTIPFIRQFAGPMDFTPGAMNNANERNFASIFSRPMSQGTRCHQLAMFVVYYAPLEMLCDTPTSYQNEPDILKLLSDMPTSWDETRGIKGRVGEYIVVARRKGKTWYLGAMTDWITRQVETDLAFLGDGKYKAVVFKDGINAHRNATDYKMEKLEVNAVSNLIMDLAPGGGWIAVFQPADK
ncbi:glycoside hydrolase family 97 protein [candidate division KSB1 bacterium]|nr:glycoside hydrolase family 97 protein [candidate division KSB1 bacterium]